jgi:hypothetical protein
MTKAEFKTRLTECGERSFFADDTITNCLKRNPLYLMCWGYRDLVKIKSTDYPEEDFGFMFKVDGLLFKGVVYVTLSFTDLFTIRFFEAMKNKGGLLERTDLQENEIYVDMLIRTIDRVVETRVEEFN